MAERFVFRRCCLPCRPVIERSLLPSPAFGRPLQRVVGDLGEVGRYVGYRRLLAKPNDQLAHRFGYRVLDLSRASGRIRGLELADEPQQEPATHELQQGLLTGGIVRFFVTGHVGKRRAAAVA